MKRVFAFLVIASVILTGCDDGDLVFEDINFDEVNSARCENKIYKINGAEALILKIGNTENDPVFTDAFPIEPTAAGQPYTIAIDNNTNKVVYRLYDGEVVNSNICGAIPAAFPGIVEEWEAISGVIEIVTTAAIISNTGEGFEGGEKITSYQNNIVFRNITFQKNDGSTQVYDEFPFGVYEVPAPVLNFNFGGIALQKCAASDIVFKSVGVEGISLNIDPVLLDTNNLGVVKSGVIGTSTNILNYYLFPPGTALDPSFFCGTFMPVAPRQIWAGVPGDANMSGVVEVVTSELPGGNGFSHIIRLKKVTLQRGRNAFLLADDYLLGELAITN